jgi:S1-C subfamily serine protease
LKLARHFLVLAGLLLLPAPAPSQQGSSEPASTRPRTATNRNAHAAPPRWGFAIGMNPGPNNTYGYPFVHTVVKGSNAERAGLAVNDTILSVNGRDARRPPLFPVREAGTRYVLRVRRGREELELTFIYPQVPSAARPVAAPAAGARPARSRD